MVYYEKVAPLLAVARACHEIVIHFTTCVTESLSSLSLSYLL